MPRAAPPRLDQARAGQYVADGARRRQRAPEVGLQRRLELLWPPSRVLAAMREDERDQLGRCLVRDHDRGPRPILKPGQAVLAKALLELLAGLSREPVITAHAVHWIAAHR